MNLSFNNTEIAFKSKTQGQLKKSNWLFTLMNNPFLVSWGTRMATLSLNMHLPVKSMIKHTIFSQFCGGESLTETKVVVDNLRKFNVGAIIDYAVEAKSTEISFEKTTSELLTVVEYASKNNIPFISIKITGIGSLELLEKIHAKQTISPEEQEEFRNIKHRLNTICKLASLKKIGVLIDAEESWIQDPVDALANAMMMQFNKSTAVVYNTIQHYRHDRLAYLIKCIELAKNNQYFLGIKLVRGAYMEKERKRALDLNYESPIQASKAATDKDFDLGMLYCLQNIQSVYVFCASHNEQSALKVANEMEKLKIDYNSDRVYFSQLFGMSDHMTFNLASAGFNSLKYLPYGPVGEVMPYLIRRAQENTAIAGQMSRELKLIKDELKRRQ
jgi:proline dehydrogenase